MSNRGQGTQRRSNRTMSLMTVLALFSSIRPGKTRGENETSSNHSGSSYGGGGRGIRDTGSIYTPKHKKLKGYQKDHKGNKVR